MFLQQLPRALTRVTTPTQYRTFAVSATTKMRIVPVPVREDNYAYLLIDEPTNKAAAVDPYDVPKVTAAAETLGVEIVSALITHHHFDHSGGNDVRILAPHFSMFRLTTLTGFCGYSTHFATQFLS